MFFSVFLILKINTLCQFFKDHKITAAELLNVIPEDLLSNLSQETKVDYYTKVRHVKSCSTY